MVIYEATTTGQQNSDIGVYIAYGIQAVDGDTDTILLAVNDVFLREEEAVALAKRCNIGRLPSYQLMDVIEDALV